MVTLDDLYQGTDNGLKIILLFYPQAKETIGQRNKPFKIRESDKTPSAFIKEIKGLWRLTDFGDSDQSLTPIDVAMRELNMKFGEAVYHLAGIFNIDGTVINPEVNKAEIRKRDAEDGEPDGFFSYKAKDKFTDEELKVMGPHVTNEHMKLLHWMSLEYYQRTKLDETGKLKTTIISSNDNYPIFMRECFWVDKDKARQSFFKIYQPLNSNKAYRFFYQGVKPQKYVNGLFELKKFYTDENERLRREQETDPESDDIGKEPKPFEMKKVPEVFICSGERDAACLKAFNSFPLWFNSETYNLSDGEWFEITKYAEKIYNIPDIDDTGIRRGMQLGMKYIDIMTTWLPDKLRTYNDNRRRPRKDFRDYVEIWPEKKDYQKLLNMAKPARFWEYVTEKGKKRYEINTDYMFYFLQCHGFYRMTDPNSKTNNMFVHVKNNIVRKIKFDDIKEFLQNYVQEQYLPVDIRNLVNNSTRISESTLSGLKSITPDFTDFTPTSQYFFFQNETWEVTAKEIRQYRPDAVDRYVWDTEVVPHPVRRLEPCFKISETEDGEYDIDINPNNRSNYFKILLNTSRVHWRKEFEEAWKGNMDSDEAVAYRDKYHFAIDGPKLDSLDIEEQKQHLINKIFTIGYLLHRHKSNHRAWVPFAMDNKIGEEEESNGGSGKSFTLEFLKNFMNTITLSGRDEKLTDNPHIYGNVSIHTDFILIDDSNKYLNFNFFFSNVTGMMNVNPKFRDSYEIPFVQSPKIAISSNYTLNNIDSSTERRILYMVYSDWYHQRTETNGYLETRTIFDDFKKDLHRDKYTEEEWNDDINCIIDCEQFYLTTIEKAVKLQPPMTNVTARNQLTIMGDAFYNWASVYWSENSENCNTCVSKKQAMDDFMADTKQTKWTAQKFTRALKAFCLHQDYVVSLNPRELCNSGHRIIQKLDGKSKEMIYIQTAGKKLDKLNTPESDDLPFPMA
jgi:hypothetical protein